jgi:hypothetical protein
MSSGAGRITATPTRFQTISNLIDSPSFGIESPSTTGQFTASANSPGTPRAAQRTALLHPPTYSSAASSIFLSDVDPYDSYTTAQSRGKQTQEGIIMTKIAVVILSDPKTGSEEALGRVFNGLVVALDAKQRGHTVTVLLQGTATRWAGLLTDKAHPLNALYEAVKDSIAGVSAGCSDFFGARDAAKSHNFTFVSECAVPGTSGLPSIASRIADGYQVVTF